jgi:hypothetical protein
MSHILFKKRMRHGVSRGPFIRNADYLHPLVLAALSTYAYIYTQGLKLKYKHNSVMSLLRVFIE